MLWVSTHKGSRMGLGLLRGLRGGVRAAAVGQQRPRQVDGAGQDLIARREGGRGHQHRPRLVPGSARLVEPGAVLARANELLCEEMPANMFVTCQYATFDPSTGRLTMANAGHNLPFLRLPEDVTEIRVTGPECFSFDYRVVNRAERPQRLLVGDGGRHRAALDAELGGREPDPAGRRGRDGGAPQGQAPPVRLVDRGGALHSHAR